MSALDDELAEILRGSGVTKYGIKLIKEAFVKAGYKQVADLSPDVTMWEGKRLMTGQRWFDRFQDKLADAKRWTSMDGTIVMSPNAALEAARKATND